MVKTESLTFVSRVTCWTRNFKINISQNKRAFNKQNVELVSRVNTLCHCLFVKYRAHEEWISKLKLCKRKSSTEVFLLG